VVIRRVLSLGVALAWLSPLLAVGAMPVAAGQTRAASVGPALQSTIDGQRTSLNIPGVPLARGSAVSAPGLSATMYHLSGEPVSAGWGHPQWGVQACV
jgi:hypothetical protein